MFYVKKMEEKTRRGEVIVLRKYLSMISLLLFSLFMVFAFITPIVVNGTSEIGDIVVISSCSF